MYLEALYLVHGKVFLFDILVSTFQCISNDPSKSKTLGREIVELYGNIGGNSY